MRDNVIDVWPQLSFEGLKCLTLSAELQVAVISESTHVTSDNMQDLVS